MSGGSWDREGTNAPAELVLVIAALVVVELFGGEGLEALGRRGELDAEVSPSMERGPSPVSWSWAKWRSANWRTSLPEVVTDTLARSRVRKPLGPSPVSWEEAKMRSAISRGVSASAGPATAMAAAVARMMAFMFWFLWFGRAGGALWCLVRRLGASDGRDLGRAGVTFNARGREIAARWVRHRTINCSVQFSGPNSETDLTPPRGRVTETGG